MATDGEMYAIMRGEYSDMVVFGVCDTLEEAELVCAELNQECIELGNRGFEPYYYNELFHMIPKNEHDVGCRVPCRIVMVNALRHKDGSLHFAFAGSNVDYGVRYFWRPPIIRDKGDLYHIDVYAQSSYTPERIMKIAQDALYKYLAEKEGLV